MFSHRLYVLDQNSCVYDLIVTPENCRLASKSKKNKTLSFDENFDVPIELDLKTKSNFNEDQAVSSTIECASSQIRHCTVETLMQPVNLIFSYGTKEVSNRSNFHACKRTVIARPLLPTQLCIPGRFRRIV